MKNFAGFFLLDDPGAMAIVRLPPFVTPTDENCALVPIDLFYYLFDTLVWIPLRHGSMERFPFEISVIGREGARTALQIISAWKNLFLHSPELIQLTGQFVFQSGLSNGDYEKVQFSKEEMLHVFATLQRLLKYVETGKKCVCLTAWTAYN